MKLFKTLPTYKNALILALTVAAFGWAGAAYAQDQTDMVNHGIMHVTKSPTCGCCGAWVALARDEGYEIEVTDTHDVTAVKLDSNVPGEMWACHTARIGGYVVEGHVPFAALSKLLREKPQITGIAVPGMPAGSPGMGNNPSARYDVISFGDDAGAGDVFFRAGQ